MFNASKGDISKAAYWLNTIKIKAKNLPVVLVGTHSDKCDQNQLKELIERINSELSQFKISLLTFISSKTGSGIDKLKEGLVGLAVEKKLVGEKISKNWIELSKTIINLR